MAKKKKKNAEVKEIAVVISQQQSLWDDYYGVVVVTDKTTVLAAERQVMNDQILAARQWQNAEDDVWRAREKGQYKQHDMTREDYFKIICAERGYKLYVTEAFSDDLKDEEISCGHVMP